MAGAVLVMLAAFSPWALLRLLPLAELASGAAGCAPRRATHRRRRARRRRAIGARRRRGLGVADRLRRDATQAADESRRRAGGRRSRTSPDCVDGGPQASSGDGAAPGRRRPGTAESGDPATPNEPTRPTPARPSPTRRHGTRARDLGATLAGTRAQRRSNLLATPVSLTRTSATLVTDERLTYRFGPLERRGLLGQLRAGQAVAVGAGRARGDRRARPRADGGRRVPRRAARSAAALLVAFAPLGRPHRRGVGCRSSSPFALRSLRGPAPLPLARSRRRDGRGRARPAAATPAEASASGRAEPRSRASGSSTPPTATARSGSSASSAAGG